MFREGLSKGARMEGGDITETQGRNRQDSRNKGPGLGTCLMCPGNSEGLVCLEQRVPGEEARGRGGLQARVGTWAFTLGPLEALGGLGHWEVWSDFYWDPCDCCVENRLGTRTGGGQEAVAGERCGSGRWW